MELHSPFSYLKTCYIIFLGTASVVAVWINWSDLNLMGKPDQSNPFLRVKTNRWIVVTSVQYPTGDVKNLASQPGWTVVVVADKKTPPDWSHPRVHFLSVEEQSSMGQFAQLLPFASYTRKNLGYLYAMANGAEWIYDTDDDNKPYGKGLEQFDYRETVSGLRYTVKSQNISEKLFNPYQFFGYSKMWPRGFPLEHLRGHSNGGDRLLLCRRMATAAVQQGIVHNDPDVDAIYRLLNADETGLHASFSKFAPPITLDAGTYSPWNSQNTLFHQRAFFTMFLPTTVAFRVTDIWRSYFAQKLLHLIGEHVAFYPVNAVQFRNAHNYLMDFEQEIDVYEKSGQMVEFLDEWTCSERTVDKCMLQLARQFVHRGFFGQLDYDLIELWLQALTNLNYTFPALINRTTDAVFQKEKFGNCREANLDLGTEDYDPEGGNSSLKRAEMAVSGYEEVCSWCSQATNETCSMLPLPEDFSESMETGTLRERQEQVLVLLANYPWKNSMGLLQRMYSPFFAMTIFCGTWDPRLFKQESFSMLGPVNFINISAEEMNEGKQYHYCFSKVRELRLQNVKGYLFLADDSIFNFWRNFSSDRILNPHVPERHRQFWSQATGNRAVELISTKFKDDEEIQYALKEMEMRLIQRNKTYSSIGAYLNTSTGKTCADILYVPTQHLDYIANLVEVLAPSRMFVECAMAKILDTFDYDYKHFWYDWDYNKDRGAHYHLYKNLKYGLHPLKLSVVEKQLPRRRGFCRTVISTFVGAIFANGTSL